MTTINRSPRKVRLTRQQMVVLQLIIQGLNSQQAADKLCLSKRTVDFHLAGIYAKFGVSNRIQALNSAHALGLIQFEPRAPHHAAPLMSGDYDAHSF